MLKTWICVLALTAVAANAQQLWDVGVIGGLGVENNLTVTNGSGSATTGFKNGAVVGAYGGEDMYRYWSGEVSYLYRQSDLKLNGAGVSESFDGHTHIFTGDILAHFRPREARIRPFVSFGAGLQVIEGTGNEGAPQPLGNCFVAGPTCFAALTATQEVQVVGEIGVGVKVQLANHFRLRIQVRDYISPRPGQTIAPGPGATLTGFPNDVIGTASLGFTW